MYKYEVHTNKREVYHGEHVVGESKLGTYIY